MSTSEPGPLLSLLRSTVDRPIATGGLTALRGYQLHALHWDERHQAVTTGFEGPLHRADRVGLGADHGHDWIRFHLRFPETHAIELRGWSHETVDRFDYVLVDGHVSVHLTGPGTDLRLRSRPAFALTHRTSRFAPM